MRTHLRLQVDQMAANEFGKYTRLASLDTSLESIGTASACTDGYACGYQIWFSWKTPTTSLHHEPNPRLIFERLFGDGSSGLKRIVATMRSSGSQLANPAVRRLHSRPRRA